MAESSEAELTMCDVLEEERELEEDAKAVLGDSDDTNCTYNYGYVLRQALYACATCTSVNNPGGICLACSYACHEGHELVELYTKRNFRCDCGNKKFENNRCRLCPQKDDINSRNHYNHNFWGHYCSCNRPYPDTEDTVIDQMIQCIICEDWYHGRHLDDSIPDSEDFGEMICKKCMDLHSFLYTYKGHYDSEKFIIVDAMDEKSVICDMLTELVASVEKTFNIEAEGSTSQNSETNVMLTEKCMLQQLKNKHNKVSIGPAFLPEDWRKQLCRCIECMSLYKKEMCSFLLDEQDTIKAYEDRGKTRNGEESHYEKGLSALSKMDRVKQIEAIHEYNNMKVQLKDYLKTFADANRAVSARDIQDFFDGMQERKRQRTDHVPHFCR